MNRDNKYLKLFGFTFERGGAHLARTMMLNELRQLFSYIQDSNIDKSVFTVAILEDNCLGKRSGQTRKLALRHLTNLYGLDSSITLYRALFYFWQRDDVDGQPMLACLCAYARDAILRQSAPFVQHLPEGQAFVREKMEEFIEKLEPGRFSKATLTSTAQNVGSTWTQSGHIHGRVKKIRVRPKVTPGVAAFALFLGYLSGARGLVLFETEYVKILDCSVEQVMDQAQDASRRGWIVFKRIGDVVEVLFPNLLNQEEMEWIREQN